MSGLFAIRPSNSEWLKVSIEEQHSRGPDKSFTYLCDDIGLGVNVLSLRKNKKQGAQPVFSKTKRTLCIFDGYIFNAQKVISHFSLEADADDFGSVFVELYEKEGKSFIDYIDGAFAIIIVDLERKDLVAARDMIGIKPLYFAQKEGEILFSSCLTAIPSKFHSVVETFPPGLVWINNKFEHEIKQSVSVSKNIERVLLSAIEKNIPKEVRWGLSLSGGVDSSIMAALAKKIDHNFSCYVFDAGSGRDERAATHVANSLDLRLKVIRPSKSDIINTLPKVIRVLCSFRSEIILGSMLSYFVAREASKDGLKVLLTGEGVDTIFGGLPKYRNLKPTSQQLKQMMIEDQNNLWRSTNRRIDHSSMLSSIEARAPFQDTSVIASARQLPRALIVDDSNDLKDKILLRLIAKKYLHNDLALRPKATISQGTGLDRILHEITEEIKYDYKIDMVDIEKFELKNRHPFEWICYSIWKQQYPEMAKDKESLVRRNLFPVSFA